MSDELSDFFSPSASSSSSSLSSSSSPSSSSSSFSSSLKGSWVIKVGGGNENCLPRGSLGKKRALFSKESSLLCYFFKKKVLIGFKIFSIETHQ